MQGKSNRMRRRAEGVEIRHQKACASRNGGSCDCSPSYRPYVYQRSSGPGRGLKVRGPACSTLDQARQWRAKSTVAVQRGRPVEQTRTTVRAAAEAFIDGAEARPPIVLTRSGTPYKPSSLREIRRNLHNYVIPELGSRRLGDVRRRDLNALVKRLQGKGLSASKIRNVIVAVRVLYREALDADEVEANPTSNLRLPKVKAKNPHRAAEATEMLALLEALPDEERALWAVAFHAGLRRGELQALRWEDVDLREGPLEGEGGLGGYLRVRRSWDEVAGEIDPKSEAGERAVPVLSPLLADVLKAHRQTGGSGLVFPASSRGDASRPFYPYDAAVRARKAWAKANAERAAKGLVPLRDFTLQDGRHTAISILRAAGVPKEVVERWLGHTSGRTVTDDYTHPLELDEQDARWMAAVVAYWGLADSARRIEQVAQDAPEAAAAEKGVG